MTNEIKENIAAALDAYLNLHRISQNEFCSRSKINLAYISAILHRKFETSSGAGKKGVIAPKWFNKIAEHIGFSIENTYWETKRTDQLMHIFATLEDAKKFGTTRVIIGATGCGKSFAAGIFAKNNPSDLFIVKVGSSDNLADILDKVIDVLAIPTARTKSKKIGDIVATLRNIKHQGRKPMIIFDESEYMKQPTLCAMKELYDNLNTHCAIVLLGTNQLATNLDKLKKRNKAGIPQLYRRIKFGITSLPGIDTTYRLFLEGFTPAVKRFLQSICDNYGELHDIIVPVLRESDRTGEPVTEDFIRKVIGMY